ncbi:MAG: DUF4139 domain-containing protein [Deltaproteobacteria bacterium]|nr:DUF4139 domain-containing protein [Deltaproteobacteria bacterium]
MWIWWLCLGLAAAEEVEAPPLQPSGAVVSAVVFPDRALVTRELEVSLEEGLNEIVLSDLPPGLDVRSIQALGSGVPGAALVGLDVRRQELVEDRRALVTTLRTRLQELADARTALQDRTAAADFELGFLGSVKGAAASQLSAELLFAPETATKVSALAELLRERVPALQEQKLEAARALRELDARQGAITREIAAVEGAAQWARIDVTVVIDSPAAGPGKVTLSYLLPGASWEPVYDLRAFPEEGKAELSLSAMVGQGTGERWEDVALTLSTARPAQGLQPPTLSPFWLERQVSYDYGMYGGAEMSDSEDGLLMERAVMAPPPPPAAPAPMEVRTAEVSARAVATTFAVPGATSLAGDGERRKVLVTEVELPMDFVRVAVPRLDPTAWLVARGTWSESWSLLPGQVSSFSEDAFVGTQAMAGVGAGGALSFGLGRDDAVAIVAETLQELNDPPNLLGKRLYVGEWRYTVTSHREAPVSVELLDRYPMTRDVRYLIKHLGDDPTALDTEGLATWALEVPAQGEVTRTTGYRVRYPKNAAPGGLQ